MYIFNNLIQMRFLGNQTVRRTKIIIAFEPKCYRKILRVPWTQRGVNATIRSDLEDPEYAC